MTPSGAASPSKNTAGAETPTVPPHVLILLTENHPRREKERNVRLDTEVPAGREFNRNEEGDNKSCLCNMVHDCLLLIERLDVLQVRRAVVFSISPAQGSASLGIFESPHSATCNPKRT